MIVVKVGGVLGGSEGALIALMIALVLHAINYWFIDKIILRMHGAKKFNPMAGGDSIARSKSNMPGADLVALSATN